MSDVFYPHKPAERRITWIKVKVLDIHPDFHAKQNHLIGKEILADCDLSTSKDVWQAFAYRYETENTFTIAKVERIIECTE